MTALDPAPPNPVQNAANMIAILLVDTMSKPTAAHPSNPKYRNMALS